MRGNLANVTEFVDPLAAGMRHPRLPSMYASENDEMMSTRQLLDTRPIMAVERSSDVFLKKLL